MMRVNEWDLPTLFKTVYKDEMKDPKKIYYWSFREFNIINNTLILGLSGVHIK